MNHKIANDNGIQSNHLFCDPRNMPQTVRTPPHQKGQSGIRSILMQDIALGHEPTLRSVFEVDPIIPTAHERHCVIAFGGALIGSYTFCIEARGAGINVYDTIPIPATTNGN